jgi:hypothetical protein
MNININVLDNIKSISGNEIKKYIDTVKPLRHCIVNLLIEYNRDNILLYYIKNIKDVSFNNIMTALFYRKLKFIKSMVECYSLKKTIDIFDLVRNLVYIFYENILDYSTTEISYMQYCLIFFEEKGLTKKLQKVHKKFVSVMINMHKLKVKKAKKIIYYACINVVCNPNHPVGYRCIEKEYNSMFS